MATPTTSDGSVRKVTVKTENYSSQVQIPQSYIPMAPKRQVNQQFGFPPAQQPANQNYTASFAQRDISHGLGCDQSRPELNMVPTRSELVMAPAKLSAECQKRRFNPVWKESSRPVRGTCYYVCNVIIDGHLVTGIECLSAREAKEWVANKALVIIRNMPIKSRPLGIPTGRHSGPATKRETLFDAYRHMIGARGQDARRDRLGSVGRGDRRPSPDMTEAQIRPEKPNLARLIDDAVKEGPKVAKALLDGIALGLGTQFTGMTADVRRSRTLEAGGRSSGARAHVRGRTPPRDRSRIRQRSPLRHSRYIGGGGSVYF
ncbi:hypothetical protein B0H63DRAFT_459416 [Podospora didyma]|uniref:Uncharacterized protein n=1 Tax=Podospora didyma TaxID=330526 RepID=A0AAE0P5S5_9PEZI|nr:hypothetical protein B0H63DRAFT_459416 [Podospora didyma]